ncbi:MAG: hypothetical protein ACXAC8_20235 [Candidatus Hodarchaeales archaeon]|jgi:DNA-binding CsgD family transcriptional regulator
MDQKPDFLTEYEFKVYQLTSKGWSPQEISDQLNQDKSNKDKKIKKPGNIRKTRVVIRKKIERELQKIADSLRLDTNLRTIPKGTGLLIGYDWVHDTYVYLILSEGMIKVWYEHNCSIKCEVECQNTLDLLLKERDLQLPPEVTNRPRLEHIRYIIDKIKRESG